MRFELFVAVRYLRAKRRQAVVGIITVISIAGVAAGVARTDRSQVPACRSRTCPIAVASAQ